MPTKYTNIGQSDGAIVGTTVADTEKHYSYTGTAIYSNDSTRQVIPLSDIGFSGDVTDLWIRFDYYVYTYSPTMVVGFFFDGNSGSDYVGLNAGKVFYGVKGGDYTSYSSSVYGQTINKVVLHATTTSLTFVVNGRTIINKTGITNGQKITGLEFKIDSGNSTTVGNNNMFSNIIVADYDCSNETLVSSASSIAVNNHYDLSRKTIVDVDLSADISRKVSNANYYRWETLGDGSQFDVHDSFVSSNDAKYSKTGIAFNAGDNKPLIKNLPSLTEVWLKFDYYSSGQWRWVQVFFNDNTSIGISGTDDATFFKFFGHEFAGVDGINTVLMHISKTTNTAELWINGTKVISDISANLTDPITKVSMSPSGWSSNYASKTNNWMSNIIISDVEIGLDENAKDNTSAETLSIDISREVSVELVNVYDVCRYVRDNTIAVTANADVLRKTTVDINLSGSTDRKIVYDAISEIDTRRRTSAYSVAINDLMCKTTVNATIEADTSRGIILTTNFAADTRISIPSVVTDKSSGLQSINISTGQSQLSDNVKIVTVNPVDINGAVTGHFFDYELNMRAEETSQTGILQEITCMTDKDEILYKKIVYTGDADARIYHGKEIYNEDVANNSDIISYMKLSKHMSKIAGVLGCNLELHSDDFISTCSLNDSGATYQSIISELCGWTSKIPNMFINASLRGNTLYIIQRGHEPNEINIDNLKMTEPTIAKKLIRTEWNNAQSTSGSGAGTGVKPPIIIDNGKSKKTEESTSNDKQEPREETETDTRYADDGGYTVTTTTRRYEAVYELHGAVMIVQETERCVAHPASTDESDTTTVTLTETYHTYDSYGWHTVETVTTVDGVLTDTHTNKSLGSTEGVTPYRARAAGEFSVCGDDGSSKYNSLVDSDFPVFGDYLKTCRDDLKWLNRKVQETVTLSIYDYTHIFNFCDRIIYNGNAYSIQSASFEKNATVVNRQDLVLIRFY